LPVRLVQEFIQLWKVLYSRRPHGFRW
jgi:hypothetical protein